MSRVFLSASIAILLAGCAHHVPEPANTKQHKHRAVHKAQALAPPATRTSPTIQAPPIQAPAEANTPPKTPEKSTAKRFGERALHWFFRERAPK